MKCVQIVGQGIPVRLSDDDAFQIVERDHDGQYCPKSLWKKYYDEIGNERHYAVLVIGGRLAKTTTEEHCAQYLQEKRGK